jgi:hypothetical protein
VSNILQQPRILFFVEICVIKKILKASVLLYTIVCLIVLFVDRSIDHGHCYIIAQCIVLLSCFSVWNSSSSFLQRLQYYLLSFIYYFFSYMRNVLNATKKVIDIYIYIVYIVYIVYMVCEI